MNKDALFQEAIARSVNLLVPWYLMASYLYYHEDKSLLSDEAYDHLCAALLEKWTAIEHHHKHLIDPEALRAGTGYYIKKEDYPAITIGAAWALMSEGRKRRKRK